MRTVIMFMLPLMQVVASAPGQSTGAADKVPYARASLLEGAPQASADWAREILDNRLSASSWRTVNAGLKLWRAVAEQTRCRKTCGRGPASQKRKEGFRDEGTEIR